MRNRKAFFDHKDYKEYCLLEYDSAGEAVGCKAQKLSTAHMFYGAVFTPCANKNVCDAMAQMIPTGKVIDGPNSDFYIVNSLSPTAFNFSKCELLDTWKVNAVRDWIYATVNMEKSTLVLLSCPRKSYLDFI